MKIPFPAGGLHSGVPVEEQPVRTSFSIQNCRPFDVTDERVRGGQRPGTALAYTTRVVGDNPVIWMGAVVNIYIEPEA